MVVRAGGNYGVAFSAKAREMSRRVRQVQQIAFDKGMILISCPNFHASYVSNGAERAR